MFGDGNAISFDARIYDPRLGRWLSMDPQQKKSPDINPYCYVINNPTRFVDPNGEFLLDVHQRISRQVLNLFKEIIPSRGFFRDFFYGSETSNFYKGFVGAGNLDFEAGVNDPDLNHSSGSTYDKGAHFDGMNYKDIIANFSKIESNVNEGINKYGKGLKDAWILGHKTGVAAHAIQDFYSHSNYIELYQQVYPSQTDASKIPTLEEALSDPQFAEFSDVLKTNLKTGEYPGSGEGFHKEMNHDVGAGSVFGELMKETKGKKVTWNTAAAESVAKRATFKLVQKVKEAIEQKEVTEAAKNAPLPKPNQELAPADKTKIGN